VPSISGGLAVVPIEANRLHQGETITTVPEGEDALRLADFDDKQ